MQRIVHYPSSKQVFLAAESISYIAAVEISPAGTNYVRLGSDTTPERAAGVAVGCIGSGDLTWVVTNGLVSGVVCASSINAGDRVTLASGGRVAAFNTITPAGIIVGQGVGPISGLAASGVLLSGAGARGFSGFITSGYATATVSGGLSGTAFNTAKVLGKATTSGGGAGSGIALLVALAG